MFIACETQWRLLPSGVRIGLDYSALEAAMRMQEIKNQTDTFRRVRVMERAAVNALKKR